jgi:hypothetical protein
VISNTDVQEVDHGTTVHNAIPQIRHASGKYQASPNKMPGALAKSDGCNQDYH